MKKLKKDFNIFFHTRTHRDRFSLVSGVGGSKDLTKEQVNKVYRKQIKNELVKSYKQEGDNYTS